MTVHVRDVSLHELTDGDLEKWATLTRVSVEPNAWLDPRFLRTAATWHATSTLRLLAVEDDARWLALLAYAPERPMRRLPISISTTATPFLITHADRHAPLVAEDRIGDAVAPLLDAYVGLRGIGHLRGIPAAGPLADAVKDVSTERGFGVHETRHYETTFAPGAEGAAISVAGLNLDIGHLDSGRRNKITRRVRQLEREAGAPLEFLDVSEEQDLYERFVTFQARGWKGDASRGGGALALDADHREWIRAAIAAFHDSGDLLAYELRSGDVTLYLSLNVRSATGAFLLLDAYDETYANRGPGTIGRVRSWQAALARTDVSVFDPGLDPDRGEASSLYPASISRVDLTLVADTLLARTRFRTLEASRRLRERF